MVVVCEVWKMFHPLIPVWCLAGALAFHLPDGALDLLNEHLLLQLKPGQMPQSCVSAYVQAGGVVRYANVEGGFQYIP